MIRLLARPLDAVGPVRLDLLLVGRLVQAQQQERPHLLARQRRQLQDHRFRTLRHAPSSQLIVRDERAGDPAAVLRRHSTACSLITVYLHAPIDRHASIFLSMWSARSRTMRRCSSLVTSGRHLPVMRRSFWNSLQQVAHHLAHGRPVDLVVRQVPHLIDHLAHLVGQLVAQVAHQRDDVADHAHRPLLDAGVAGVALADAVDLGQQPLDVVEALDLDQVQLVQLVLRLARAAAGAAAPACGGRPAAAWPGCTGGTAVPACRGRWAAVRWRAAGSRGRWSISPSRCSCWPGGSGSRRPAARGSSGCPAGPARCSSSRSK